MRHSTYILVDIREGGSSLGSVIDRVDIDLGDPQPALSAKRHFQRRGYDPEFNRVFVMLGEQPIWEERP